MDGKPRPSVQQLADPPTVSFPEKWPRLLKELGHSVKQKKPNSEKPIKTPARNKDRDNHRSPALPNSAAHSQNKPGFDQKPKSESADDTEDAEGELIKPIYEICG